MRFFLIFSLILFAQSHSDGPFWRVKEKAFTKIVEDRAILVSVHVTETEKSEKNLKMIGGALTNSPIDQAFAIAKDYPKLKEVSSHFKEVKWNPQKKELYVHGEAFDWHARMTLAITEIEINEGNKKGHKRIDWRVVSGSFQGMTGQITFEPYKKSTVMGLSADYVAKKLPLPEFFVEFALEVVLQNVAGKMRTYIEKNTKR